MNFKPLGNRVVVRQTAAATTTKSGLLLPESSQRKPLEGEVVAVGPGLNSESPLDVSVGDYVVIAPGTATEIRISNETYLIVPETDIIGILE